MPVKMRRKANRNALLCKLLDNEVKVIDNLTMGAPKTKEFQAALDACGVNRSCLVAVRPENENVLRSARNCADVTVCHSGQLTCFEMMNNRFLVISKADLESWITGPSSVTNKKAKAGKKHKEAA